MDIIKPMSMHCLFFHNGTSFWAFERLVFGQAVSASLRSFLKIQIQRPTLEAASQSIPQIYIIMNATTAQYFCTLALLSLQVVCESHHVYLIILAESLAFYYYILIVLPQQVMSKIIFRHQQKSTEAVIAPRVEGGDASVQLILTSCLLQTQILAKASGLLLRIPDSALSIHKKETHLPLQYSGGNSLVVTTVMLS